MRAGIYMVLILKADSVKFGGYWELEFKRALHILEADNLKLAPGRIFSWKAGRVFDLETEGDYN